MGVEDPWPTSLAVAKPSALERARGFLRRPLAAEPAFHAGKKVQ